MNEHQPRIIIIKGYSDNAGSEKYNMRLSEKRAQAIENYLVAKGVIMSRMSVSGLG
ncbi:OmpA family protein [Psychromonas sp. CD1]|uniref:OmpA family protein n=1 Tax=Psychromonas sp. CD1 TaxID=1979839 RepID=UPI000B9BEBA2